VLVETVKIRVLVVDDHTGMREGISAVVNAQPDMIVVGEASDGDEAIEKYKTLRPDVSLVDWNLPNMPGEEVIKTVSTEFPNARFVVITALNDDDCIPQALRLGVQACLRKDMLRRELVPAIRAVHHGKQYVPDQISNRLKKG
jgi:DNA-binding NarL/FixJ family response regulator